MIALIVGGVIVLAALIWVAFNQIAAWSIPSISVPVDDGIACFVCVISGTNLGRGGAT